MPAEEREQERGAQSAQPAAGVSMRALLASCAAADAVSKPPSDGDDGAVTDAGSSGESGSGSTAEASQLQPRQDAA
ncbi:MAG TPA: hypothetical protein VNS49_21555 [Streptomyces sp.]|nr:hypothetical protein [Streptomyces sp.]